MGSEEKEIDEMKVEDLENIRRGYLPASGEVLQIVSASGFKACFKNEDGEEEFIPLVAWAFLRDGTLLPVLYDKINRCHIVAYAIAGFIEVTHKDFIDYGD